LLGLLLSPIGLNVLWEAKKSTQYTLLCSS
jgi:hypothetical protein